MISDLNNRKRLAYIGIALLAVAACVFIIYDLNGGSLDLSGREIRIIVTDSMDGEPTEYPLSTIEKDSLVMVRTFSDDETKAKLSVGDVIQFRYNGVLNHHRVISNDQASGLIIAKGDNSPVSDHVLYQDITGQVVGKSHILGMAVSFIKSNWLIIILAIVVITSGFSLVRELRRPSE